MPLATPAAAAISSMVTASTPRLCIKRRAAARISRVRNSVTISFLVGFEAGFMYDDYVVNKMT